MRPILSAHPSGYTVPKSYAHCAQFAKSHYENFTVVSWLLPSEKQNHLYAVYAFCRFTDDLGDEHKGDRLRALDEWERDLLRCYDGNPYHPYLVGLQSTIREFDIPREPFLKLIEANRMDQRINRHPTYADLDYYCQHSANPVGHLVLYIFGHRNLDIHHLSNYTCTALQLTNFLQDLSKDYSIGRVYLPQEDMDRFGYTEDELRRRIVTDGFRQMMAFEVERTRSLFRKGLKIVDIVDGGLKLDIALFSKGGVKILDTIEKEGYDVLNKRPSLSKTTKLRMMVATALRLKILGKL